jgi:predicted nucleic-acid-binding Zn-ribbon protein
MENTFNEKKSFVCVKCGNTTCISNKISTTGSILTKIFNLQSNKFITVSCLKCGYTELYKTTTSGIENVADFLIGK